MFSLLMPGGPRQRVAVWWFSPACLPGTIGERNRRATRPTDESHDAERRAQYKQNSAQS